MISFFSLQRIRGRADKYLMEKMLNCEVESELSHIRSQMLSCLHDQALWQDTNTPRVYDLTSPTLQST